MVYGLKRYDKMIMLLFYDSASYHGYTQFYYKLKKSSPDKYVNIKYYINNRFDNITFGLHEILFRINNSIEECPTCIICGKPIRYNKKLHAYKKYCCASCRMKDSETQQHIHNVALQRYGSVNNSSRISEANNKRSSTEYAVIIEKRRQTNEKIHGNRDYTNTEKMKQTCLGRYGVVCTQLDKEVHKKTVNTLQDKYGVDHQSKSSIVKEKISNGVKENWDSLSEDERKEHIDKIKLFWDSLSEDERKKHGQKVRESFLSKSDDEKLIFAENARIRAIKMWESFSEEQVHEIFNKYKKTRELRTPEEKESEFTNRSNGIKRWMSERTDEEKVETIKKLKETLSRRTPEEWKAIAEKSYKTLKETLSRRTPEEWKAIADKTRKTLSRRTPEEWKAIAEKSYKTKREHGTFNTSKIEEALGDYILSKFPDVKHQYKTPLYPFACDYYIPTIDTYIEYQGSWTHGGHPFGTGEDDDKIVESWRNKHTKYYDNAITTWTIRDVKKREIAKMNNLAYHELWGDDIEKHKKFIDSLKHV